MEEMNCVSSSSNEDIAYTTCKNGCCKLSTWHYTNEPNDGDTCHQHPQHIAYYPRRMKAGMILVDESSGKLLLVRSKALCWGFPKGGQNGDEETPEECAMREVKEETGLSLTIDDTDQRVVCIYETIYFLKFIPERVNRFTIKRKVNDDKDDNDVTGIGWVNPECRFDSKLKMTCHCRRVVSKLNKTVV